VALVSGAVTLLFTLSPSLKPDPGESISAKLDVLSVEPHARYGAYLNRLGKLGAPLRKKVTDPEVLGDVGFIVNLGIVVNGRKRRDMKIGQATYVVRSGRRYRTSPTVATFKSDTPSDAWVVPVFVRDRDFRFFERFELFDRDVMLAIADTDPLESP